MRFNEQLKAKKKKSIRNAVRVRKVGQTGYKAKKKKATKNNSSAHFRKVIKNQVDGIALCVFDCACVCVGGVGGWVGACVREWCLCLHAFTFYADDLSSE